MTKAKLPTEADSIAWTQLTEQLREYRANSRLGLSDIARQTGIPVQQLAWLEGGLTRSLASAAELNRLIPKLQALLSQPNDKIEQFVPPFLRK